MINIFCSPAYSNFQHPLPQFTPTTRGSLVRSVLYAAINGNIKVFVTPAIIHIAGYQLKKEYGIQVTMELLRLLFNDVKVIDSSHMITVQALQSGMTDVEDAL